MVGANDELESPLKPFSSYVFLIKKNYSAFVALSISSLKAQKPQMKLLRSSYIHQDRTVVKRLRLQNFWMQGDIVNNFFPRFSKIALSWYDQTLI
jgi:hypothetical protein